MNINIVPMPNYYKYKNGTFNALKFRIHGDFDFAIKYLSDLFGARLAKDGESAVDIHFMNNKKFIDSYFNVCDELVDSSYVINIDSEGIKIAARADVGAFYAVQTLRQYIELDVFAADKPLEIPFIEIRDIPWKKWRGHMLDITRHFFNLNELKRHVELISMLKINKFHIHFSDDQGFRIALDKFPKLESVGGHRKDSQIGGWQGKIFEGKPHDGCLSKDEIQELISFAADRGIEIIPEIDLPGHTIALIAAYPELSCTGKQQEVFSHFGRSYDLVCAGKERAFELLFEILDEIADIFPSKYFHIGGDEAPKDIWKNCPDCQQRMKDEGLADEDMLQGYFTNRICEHLSKKGKVVIVWNEALTDNLLPVQVGEPCKIIGQYWVGDGKSAKENAIKGREIISSHNACNYLDYTHTSLTLKKIYTYNPMPPKLSQSFENNIIGIEAPLWTEWVRDIAKVDFNTFPRLCGLAENAWTYPELKEYKDFEDRIIYSYLKILDKLGVNYAPPLIFRGVGMFKKAKVHKDWCEGCQYLELDLAKKNINGVKL